MMGSKNDDPIVQTKKQLHNSDKEIEDSLEESV